MALPSFRSAAFQKPPTNLNLLGAWSFDENTGTTAADNSGHGHTLTLGASVSWTTGHTNSAVSTNGENTSVHGSWSISLPITIMAWCKPTDLTTNTNRLLFGIFDTADASGNSEFVIWAQRGDFGTHNVLQGNVRIDGSLVPLSAAAALTVNTWVHLALTYDGTNVRLYRDGVVVASSSTSGTIFPGAFHLVVLGDSTHNYGVVDDVRVFGKALTQPQVAYYMGLPVS
jgi:hypothetical protein